MASETDVATAALATAIAALVIAFGQLLQQLFGTAEGYRRCQSSVIGGWSRLATLRLRWSSFRFEVRVTTPHFEICDPGEARELSKLQKGSHLKDSELIVAITGSQKSRGSTFSRTQEAGEDYKDESEDAVSWTSLLEALHNRQKLQLLTFHGTHNWIRRPLRSGVDLVREWGGEIVCLKLKTRSWDLMPPDVVRPLASTTLGTLISMAHRMGMVWIDLIPREGKLRAEGLGQSFSATLIRGMGMVVEYTVETSQRPRLSHDILRSLRIPSEESDKMACGIIPGYGLMDLWDIPIRSEQHDPDIDLIVGFLERLEIQQPAIDTIKESVTSSNTAHHWPAFTDLLGLWSMWLPMHQSCITNVASPFGQRVFPVTGVYEARVVWRWHLNKMTKPLSAPMQKILDCYDEWATTWKSKFDQPSLLSDNSPDEGEYIDWLSESFQLTNAYYLQRSMSGMQFPRSDFTYCDLVRAHIDTNAHSLREAEENIKADKHRNDGRVGAILSDTVFTERAFIYADNVPRIVAEMDKRGHVTSQVEDAWWTLMLRGQLWEASVNRIPDRSMKVPSSYYNSSMRIYIM